VDESRFFALVGEGLLVFEVKRAADAYQVEVALRCRELGNAYCPPVQHGDHLYGFRGEFLTCVDAGTGKRVWKSRPPGGHGLLLVNDKLVIFGAEGRVVVAPATPEGYREEASLEVLGRSAFTWPSFADGRIYLRNPEEIVAIDVVKAGAVAAAPAPVRPGPAAGAGAVSGGEFARFIKGLETAPDRQAAVDEYFASRSDFPVVEGELVHFVYRGEVSDVAIVGPMVSSGRPEPLAHVEGTDLHYRSDRFAPGCRIEYAFEIDLEPWPWRPDPLNPRSVPGSWGDTQLSEVLLAGYQAPGHIADPDPESKGRLETFELQSEKLEAPRRVTVYLPRAYDAETQRRFPLLVVTDGSSWIEKGLLTNTLDNLIGRSVAPLVVALVDPIDMFWLEAGGSRTPVIAGVLADELVPELERRYRIEPAARARAIMGSRDYGLTAAYTAMKHPEVFGNAAVQSIGLQNGTQGELLRLLERPQRVPVRFYLDWNLYEFRAVVEGWDYGADSRAFAAALRKNGYAYTGGEVADAHGWGSWRARSDRILETFFPLAGAGP
jgi:enterochelin esterase family protein